MIDNPIKLCYGYGVGAYYVHPVSYYYGLYGGMEFYYDGYLKEDLKRKGIKSDFKKFAVGMGHSVFLGRFVFFQFIAPYLYGAYSSYYWFYHRHELLFAFSPYFSVGVFLKAHLQVAEWMGFTFRFTLPLHRKESLTDA